ncbi:MAG: alpha/beta hydrolase [Pseudohongiellaceae bacterium]
MFSPNDAEALRQSLSPIQFQESTPDSALLEQYRAHYGLKLDTVERPVDHRLGTFSVTGADDNVFQVVCQYFSLPQERHRGTAFLLHGYFDHVGLYGHLIRHCLELGLSVVIFDQPGHGLSSGVPASIDSFARYVSALDTCLQLADAQQLAKPWYMIGQSTGAAVLMDALQQQTVPLLYDARRFILLAPLLRPRHWPVTRLQFAVLRHFLSSTRRVFVDNSHDREFLEFLKNHDALQCQVIPIDWIQAMIDYQRRFYRAPIGRESLHVIQGTDDGTVDWQFNLDQIVAKFPESRTYMVAGARHHLVNESEYYRERIFGLISEMIFPPGEI